MGRSRRRRLRREFEVLDVRALRRGGAIQRGESYLGEILITWRPSPFGGSRAFARCPGCGKECEVLFDDGKGVGCRVCQLVAYETSSVMQRIDRLYARRDHILDALGLPAPAPSWDDPSLKPRGMHFSTYARQLDKARRYEAAALGAGLAMLRAGPGSVLSSRRPAP